MALVAIDFIIIVFILIQKMKFNLIQLLIAATPLVGGLKDTCDTSISPPGCRGEGVLPNPDDLESMIYPTYTKCPSVSSSCLEGDFCDSIKCCDNPNVITAVNPPPFDNWIFLRTSYTSNRASSIISGEYFEGNFDCIDKSVTKAYPLVERETIKNGYNDYFNFQFVVFLYHSIDIKGRRLDIYTRPFDGEWEFKNVFWKLTNKYTGTVYHSAYFDVSFKCDPDVDGQLFHNDLIPGALKSFFPAKIMGQQIQIEYRKGWVECRTSTPSSTSTYSWSIIDNDGRIKPDFVQNDTHIILELVNSVNEYSFYWKPVLTEDETGLTFITDAPLRVQLACVSDSNTFTSVPDSPDFPHTQSYQIGSDPSLAIFKFKDPVSPLLLKYPDIDCGIVSRVIKNWSADKYELSPEKQSDGFYHFKFLGPMLEEKVFDFQVNITDKSGQNFTVSGLQFIIECGELSNNITSGPFEQAVYKKIEPGLCHKIPKFTETGEKACSITGYKIIEAKIEVYDVNDELIETLTGQESEITLVSESEDFLEIYFGNHGDGKRVYFFKIQGLVNDVIRHTTEEITVTVKNEIFIQQPENATFVNATGPINYTFPRSFMRLENPSHHVISYSLVYLSYVILHEHEDGKLLSTNSTEYTVDFSSSPDVIFTFPFHCDYGRNFTFVVKAETTGTIEIISDPISVESYNNMTINASLQTPVSIRVKQYSEGHTYDFSQYLVLSQPGCTLRWMAVTDIYNPTSQSSMSDQDVKDMMQFDQQFKLHLLNTKVQRKDLKIYVTATYSEDLIYSFNSFYLIDLIISYVQRETDIQINIKPLFDTAPKNLHIVVDRKSQQETFLLPEVIDEDPASVTFEITNGFDESFMKLGAREIQFDRFTKNSQGNHSLQLRITDSDGQFNDYDWSVSIDYIVQEGEQYLPGNSQVRKKIEKESDFVAIAWVSNEIEEESKDREPIEIRIKDFNENGELTLIYSEELFPIEHFKEFGVNLTSLNQNISQVLNLEYHCFKQKDDEVFPELTKYQIKEFTNYTLVLKLNFQNPLYVSSYGQKDGVSITFFVNKLFTSVKDNFNLRVNYTLNWIEVPSQMANQKDFLQLSSIGSSSEKSMLLSLIIPFIFMVFKSASMDRVWSLFNMLQLSTNLINYNTLQIPANHQFITKVVKNVVFFNLMKNELVQLWLEKYVLGPARALQEFIFQLRPIVIFLVFSTLALIIACLQRKTGFIIKIALNLKEKMMWNGFLRGQIQKCFPTALLTFGTLKSMYGQQRPDEREHLLNEQFHSESDGRLLKMVNYEWLEDVEKSPMACLKVFYKLTILVFFPFFCYYFLKKNKNFLQDLDFQTKFISLYKDLKQRQRSVYQHTCYFTLRRVLMTFFTVYFNSNLVLNVYINFYASLFMIMHLFLTNPFQLSLNNTFEKMNEIYKFFLCYSLIFYSNFVPSPEIKYSIGWYMVYSLLTIGAINISIVSYDLLFGLYYNYRKEQYQRKWQAYEAMLDKMAKFIIYDIMKETPDLIQSKKEIELYVLHFKNEYTVQEMEAKIKEIKSRDRQLNEISVKDLPETQTEEYTKEVYEFKKWYIRTNMNLEHIDPNREEPENNLEPRDRVVIRKEPLNLRDTEEAPKLMPEQIEEQMETPRFLEEEIDQRAIVKALLVLRDSFVEKQLSVNDPSERAKLETEYLENKMKIVKDEIMIENYFDQQNKGIEGPEAIQKGSLNQNFITMKAKR